MIKQIDSSIKLISPDGNSYSFDLEKLQYDLIRCFSNAGIRESYLSEDIALAVEYALCNSSRTEKVFAESEINASVVKILEDANFPEVAAIYRHNSCCAEVTVDCVESTIKDLIRRHVGVSSDLLDPLVLTVKKAGEKIGIRRGSPSLFIELAKYFKSQMSDNTLNLPMGAATKEHPANHSSSKQNRTRYSVNEDMLLSQVSPETRELLQRGVIRFSGIGKIFPNIRLTFMLTEYVKMLNLSLPVTEMDLIRPLYQASIALNECCKELEKLHQQQSASSDKLLLYLYIPDVSLFAQEQLQATWPEAKAACLELLENLHNEIENKIFKIKTS